MKGVIETLKFTDSNGEKYNLYPRTLIECISNQNGDSLEDTLQQYVDTQFSDTYADKTYVAEQIAASNHLIREIVTEIPTVETAEDNVIYMYKVDSATGNDVYQEYQLIGGQVVLVGDTSVDLSNYVQSETLDNYLKTTGGKISTSNGHVIQLNREAETGAVLVDFYRDDELLGCLGLEDADKPIFRDTTDSANYLLHSGNYTDYALPKTGGRVTGNLYVQNNSANAQSSVYFADKDSNRYGSIFMEEVNGSLKRYDANWANKYTIIDSGNVGSYALPKSGGELEDTSNTANSAPLLIRAGRQNTVYPNLALVGFKNSANETLGFLGFDGKENPIFRDTKQAAAGTNYTLLHTGNKPNGSYIGTGVDNTVATGGVGQALIIRYTYNSNDIMAIVTRGGAIYKNGTTVQGINGSTVTFLNGTLGLIGNNVLNQSGIAYYYTVI